LPDQAILTILKHINTAQLVRCREVCKKWRDIIDAGKVEKKRKKKKKKEKKKERKIIEIFILD